METTVNVQPLTGTLKYRSRGEFVKLLQQILNNNGYQLDVDGYFGKQTEDAVMDFQLKKKLKQDGIVGSKTWMMLNQIVRQENIKPKPADENPEGLLKRGKRGEMVLLLQENLRKLGYDVIADGAFGAGTENAVKQFQRDAKIPADGVVGPKTWLKIQDKLALKISGTVEGTPITKEEKQTINKFLSEKDLQDFAQRYGLEVAAVKAVHEVESSGRGFKNNQIKILFEGHIFWRELKKRGMNPASMVAGNENIIYSGWKRNYYGEDQHARLEKAKRIHKEAALCSASYGLFQIMGFHASSLGFASAEEFVNFMDKSEANQLEAFGRFLKKNQLVNYLKNKDWAGFAKRYNGPGYKQNKYDTKMANAYTKYKNMGS